MWIHNIAQKFLLKPEAILAAGIGIRHFGNALNPFKISSSSSVCVIPSVISSRAYRGSRRNRRIKKVKKNLRMKEELEYIYDIPTKPSFNQKAWFKSNYFAEFNAFQYRLNIKFNNHKILMSAFAHPSFTDELKDVAREELRKRSDMKRRFELSDETSDIHSFQNLSLLGYTATLSAIKDKIYNRYPSITSSICADICKFLMSRGKVCQLAKHLAIDEMALLSTEFDRMKRMNKEHHLAFTKADIICDTFYSVVGAIQIDLGHESAASFVNDFIVELIDYEDLGTKVKLIDPQDELQKMLSLHGVTGELHARTMLETGIRTDFPFFQVGVFINGCMIGVGSGPGAVAAATDAFKMSVFSCLEGDVEFSRLHKRAVPVVV